MTKSITHSKTVDFWVGETYPYSQVSCPSHKIVNSFWNAITKSNLMLAYTSRCCCWPWWPSIISFISLFFLPFIFLLLLGFFSCVFLYQLVYTVDRWWFHTFDVLCVHRGGDISRGANDRRRKASHNGRYIAQYLIIITTGFINIIISTPMLLYLHWSIRAMIAIQFNRIIDLKLVLNWIGPLFEFDFHFDFWHYN